MLTLLMYFIIEKLNSEDLTKWASQSLDLLEETILKSENNYDKSLPSTICWIRKAFALPGNN